MAQKDKSLDSAQFDNRYPFEVKIEENANNIKEARENYAKISITNIKRMRSVTNRLKSLDYFDRAIFDKSSRVEELRQHKEKGGKVIGVFCIQVPDELIYAAGAIPLRMSCGFYDSISPAEEIIPKNTCPLIKSSVGFNFLKINPLFDFCDAIIIPTTCDGKKKMADVLSNYHTVWSLELPNDKDNPASRDFWVEQIKILKDKLEKLTGAIITKEALKQSILKLHKRTAISRELFELRKNKKIVITGRDTYLIMQTAFFDNIDRWLLQVEVVIEEMKNNMKANKVMMPPTTPRIIMTGSALIWPNMKLLHTVEESGAVVVGDDSCACGQYFYNPAELDDWSMKAMIEALSDKYLLPTVCPIFVHSDDRIDRLLELVNQYQADGVVYHILRLCQVFDFEYTKVSRVFEKKKIPMIKIETEYSEEDAGQIKTRIEAFIEMLEVHR
jgi:benzoyl-CoA reductase/2-hydroxyglutaryl-CoA dehydratase subunit BcrC/BadD/HgdB